jgi:hypothetical protein
VLFQRRLLWPVGEMEGGTPDLIQPFLHARLGHAAASDELYKIQHLRLQLGRQSSGAARNLFHKGGSAHVFSPSVSRINTGTLQ